MLDSSRHQGPDASRLARNQWGPNWFGSELVGRLDEFHEHASGVFRVDEIDP